MTVSLDPSLSPAAIAWPAACAQLAADQIVERIVAGHQSVISDLCVIRTGDAIAGLLLLVPSGSRHEAREVVLAEVVDRVRLALRLAGDDDVLARARLRLEILIPSQH